MVNEIWKDINGYEGLYQISNFGNVKSLPRQGAKGKILKPSKINIGYLRVGLNKNGKCKRYLIHRLVAEAFLPNPDNKPCIDHINANKTDNRICNLQWVTHKENMNNPLTIDKISKPIIQFSKRGRNSRYRRWRSSQKSTI